MCHSQIMKYFRILQTIFTQLCFLTQSRKKNPDNYLKTNFSNVYRGKAIQVYFGSSAYDLWNFVHILQYVII